MDFFLKLFALWLSAVHLASNCFAGVFEPGVPMVNIYGAPIGYGGGGIDEQHLKLESRTREWCFTLQNRYSQTLNVGVRVHLVDGDTRSFEDAQLLVNANSLLSSGRRLRAPIDHLEVLYLEDAVGNRLFDVNPPPITPEKGATLSGSSSVVSYPPIAPPVGGAPTQYQLSFGNSRGTSDIFNGDVTTATQVQVANLPTDGRTLYARLNYYIAGAWFYHDYTYLAANVPIVGFGHLRVELSAVAAVTLGAQWAVDGGTYNNSGVTLSYLSEGSHMITFKEVNGWVTPASQIVNIIFDQTTTASGVYSLESTQINLTPYKPATWPDSLVLSNTTGTNVHQAVFGFKDILYVDWAAWNAGTKSITTTFYIDLLVDGSVWNRWQIDRLIDPFMLKVQDFQIGSLSPGSHTIKIKIDPDRVVNEFDETDNEYQKTIFVNLPPPEQEIAISYGSTNLADGSAVKRNFGTVLHGRSGTPKTFKITNMGVARLTDLWIVKDGSQKNDFVISSLTKTTLGLEESATFTVTFKPTARGDRNAAIHIRSNDKDESSFDIKLFGVAK